jgi:hypothetical protein
LLAVSDLDFGPFLHLAARHAFWKVEKCQLTSLAKLRNVKLPKGASLFETVCALIRDILPGTTDEDCIKYAKQRVAQGEKADTWHDEISACDEAQAVLEKSDAQAVKSEQTSLEVERKEHK